MWVTWFFPPSTVVYSLLTGSATKKRPIFKIKEGYAKKLRRQEYIQGLLASKTLEELGQV